jgi:peptidoglycan/LPS O-acetylase OafA/YrhL
MGSSQKLKELESLRGFAAAYVFIHHARPAENVGVGSLLYFGQEAVILFFLLSGFVIYYATSSPNHGPLSIRDYLIHRTRRIYPLLIISLMAAYISASIAAGTMVPVMWPNLMQNIFMMQDVSALKRGVWADTYYGNSPLWSLSYEWWFYLLFIPLELLRPFRAQAKLRAVAILSIVGFCTYQLHPNPISLFASYFIIWWVGVEMAREYRTHAAVTFTRQKAVVATLIGCAFLWAMPILSGYFGGERLRFGIDPVLQTRHFFAAGAIVVTGLIWRWARLRGFRYTLGPFRILAPISYSLYLLHVPVLAALEHWGMADPIVRAISAAILLIPICYLLEVRLQRIINRWTDAMTSLNAGKPIVV